MKLPSDIIIGVMQAANPARVQIATTRLEGLATSTPTQSSSFAEILSTNDLMQNPTDAAGNDILLGVMNSADPKKLAAATEKLASLSQAGNRVAASTGVADPYGKFEGFLLRTAFEEILPKADASTFGDGFAGGVWRSMAAEQFANLFADRGGIGIADMIRNRTAAHQAPSQPVAATQWPYFSQTSVSPLA